MMIVHIGNVTADARMCAVVTPATVGAFPPMALAITEDGAGSLRLQSKEECAAPKAR